MTVTLQAIIYSTLAGVSTVLGAIIVLILGRPGRRTLSVLLGFAAGIMLAISAFELIPEALEFSTLPLAAAGFIFGGIVMWIIDRIIPHLHLMSDAEDTNLVRTGYLVVLGIALHNLPEGLAIGAGLEASPELSLFIAISIGLHNIPEGMATTGPLKAGGLTTGAILLLNLLAGLMTPLGTILGLIFFGLTAGLIGAGLAFAGGAMIYIAINELIPEAQKTSQSFANAGIFLGLLLGFMIFS